MFLAVGLALVLHACQERPDESTSLGSDALTSITITPANPTLADPTTQQMTATGTYDNGTTADITDEVNWVSEYPTIATISDEPNDSSNPKGRLKTVFTGSTTITARSGDIKTSTIVTVTSPQLSSIEITPGYSSFALDVTSWVQMKATGIYEDSTRLDLTEFATWSSGTTSVATITNVSGSQGRLSCLTTGTTTVTASFRGVTGTTDLVLTTATIDGNISVTPVDPSYPEGIYQPFKATALLSDGTTQDVTNFAVWDSDDTTAALVSNDAGTPGLYLALTDADAADDTPVISADLNAAAATDSTTTVLEEYNLYTIEINPEYPNIAQGVPYQLKAIGIFKNEGQSYYIAHDITDWVTWSSSDVNLATVSNAGGSKGLVTLTDVPGAADRTVTISASSPLFASYSGSTTLTVKSNSLELTSIAIEPSDPTDHIYTKQTFKAFGTYSDGTNSYVQDISKSVIWSSSDTSVAVISNEESSAGKTTNRAAGETTVTATMGDVSGTSTLTVKSASFAFSSMTITPDTLVGVGVRSGLQLTATATFSDGSTSFSQDVTENVVWTSSLPGNGEISNTEGTQGLVVGISGSTSTVITAEWLGNPANVDTQTVAIEDMTAVNVSTVSISEAASADTDGTTQLTATVTYSGTSNTQDISEGCLWSSSRPEVASVLNIPGRKGKVVSNGEGSATITCRLTDETGTVNETATHTFTVD